MGSGTRDAEETCRDCGDLLSDTCRGSASTHLRLKQTFVRILAKSVSSECLLDTYRPLAPAKMNHSIYRTLAKRGNTVRCNTFEGCYDATECRNSWSSKSRCRDKSTFDSGTRSEIHFAEVLRSC